MNEVVLTGNGNMEELDCSVYVDVAPDNAELLDRLERTLNAKLNLQHRAIESKYCKLNVRHNPDFDPQKKTSERDEFLFFECELEAFPTSEATVEVFRETIARVLRDLWSGNIKAVCVGAFTDNLPYRGGMDR